MYFEEVDIREIDFEDDRYRILNPVDSSDLEESIKEFGLINPVKLIKINNAYKVVAGWGRLSAIKKLKYKKAPANIYLEDELPADALYKVIYIDNRHRSNDLLKAELINRIQKESQLGQDELINDVLTYFELNPSISNLKRYSSISTLSDEIKSAYLDDKLSFEQLHMLSEIKNSEDRTDIFRCFLASFKFNNNESRDLIKDLIIIKQRDNISIKKIWGLIKEDLGEKVNKNDLRKVIKKICYPKLTGVEKSYQKRLNELTLSDNVRIVNHPYFESNDLEVRIRFKESGELSEAIKNLECKIRQGAVDRLMGIVKEGK